MIVFIDTNILISSALNVGSTPYRAFIKAVTFPNRGIVCEQNIEELYRIFDKKFPVKKPLLDQFLTLSRNVIEVVPTPIKENKEENKIRDIKDRPILRAAINANADILLTGDKDFLESGIVKPKIMTASQFLNM